MKVGLLGGSFNPAHEGHVYISQQAIMLLSLDEVWWLVSPQNPLKSVDGMRPFCERFSGAEKVISGIDKVRVSDIENRLGISYTCDTISALQDKFPSMDFVWLMGADNLVQIHKWKKWHNIFNSVHVAIFDRRPYSYRSLASNAAIQYSKRRSYNLMDFMNSDVPSWVYIRIKPYDISSTEIRSGGV